MFTEILCRTNFFRTLITAAVFGVVSLEDILDLNDESYPYNASWASLDKRPTPSWYDQAKIGILVHWGVHSVPSYHSERFFEAWQMKEKTEEKVVKFMKKNYPHNFTYQDFGNKFKAEYFDANRLTDIVVNSGAKYIIVVAKHHDGFCMWPSMFAGKWHSGAVGPKRDLLLEVINSVRLNSDLYVGLLYSMLEWSNATLMDQLNNPLRPPQTVVKYKLIPELFYLAGHYRPDLIRGGGSWLASSSYYKTEHFMKWLYNKSPIKDTVVVNDQWGKDTFCKHGGYYQCDNVFDNDKNNTVHKFENVVSLDTKSWGYRRDATSGDYLDISNIIRNLVVTVCNGGNVVFSFGLTKEGLIPPIIEHRLSLLGRWLQINGEAIYGTTPWIYQTFSNNKSVYYSSRNLTSTTVVYAFFFTWPANNTLKLSRVTSYWATTVKMLSNSEALNWTSTEEEMFVNLNPPSPDIPKWSAWVLRLKCLKIYASEPNLNKDIAHKQGRSHVTSQLPHQI